MTAALAFAIGIAFATVLHRADLGAAKRERAIARELREEAEADRAHLADQATKLDLREATFNAFMATERAELAALARNAAEQANAYRERARSDAAEAALAMLLHTRSMIRPGRKGAES